MATNHELDNSSYWAGLGILDRLSEPGAVLTSEDVRDILGTRGVKGIGAALSGTRQSLRQAGIRLDEAITRKTVRRRSVWTSGPRIRQARHVLEHTRRKWSRRTQPLTVPLKKAEPGHPGPVLVLRALKVKGGAYRVDGGMAELDAILEDEWLHYFDEEPGRIGEVFIDRIEPGPDMREVPVPDGYGENGIWIRGQHDYAEPRVSGAIGTGRFGSMIAWIGEATWIERRIVLVDEVQQVERVLSEFIWMHRLDTELWRDVEAETRFQHIEWIGSIRDARASSAPPLRMRLRCWYEVVAETARGKRFLLREEGLRGDETRTAMRAIERWRKSDSRRANEPVAIHEIRIAKRQPRPMPPP